MRDQRVYNPPQAARFRTWRSTLLTFAVLVAPTFSKGEAAQTYKVDPSNSSITFEVRHMVVSTVRGAFTEFEGELCGDDTTSSWTSLRATIQAASIDTHNNQRDRHLRSAEFFDVERFPHIEFLCSTITRRAGEWIARGRLSLHGVTQEIEFPITIAGPITDPWGNSRLGIEATFMVRRQDYGISWNESLDNGGLVVGDEVWAHVNVEAVAPD